jgi:hypothetical protein
LGLLARLKHTKVFPSAGLEEAFICVNSSVAGMASFPACIDKQHKPLKKNLHFTFLLD